MRKKDTAPSTRLMVYKLGLGVGVGVGAAVGADVGAGVGQKPQGYTYGSYAGSSQ